MTWWEVYLIIAAGTFIFHIWSSIDLLREGSFQEHISAQDSLGLDPFQVWLIAAILITTINVTLSLLWFIAIPGWVIYVLHYRRSKKGGP